MRRPEDSSTATLTVNEDGAVYLIDGGAERRLPIEAERFVLRRFYEARENGEPLEGGRLDALADAMRLEARCSRHDCREPIAKQRQLNAINRDALAKYCSLSCESLSRQRRREARRPKKRAPKARPS